MRQSIRVGAAIAVAATLGPIAVTAAVSADNPAPRAAAVDRPVDAVGLSSDGKSLSVFSLTRPSELRQVGTITGLVGDTAFIGIDMRIATGGFYGVGNQGGIYTFNRNNAKATKVGQLTAALSGTVFGVDFNPAADRLRIVSDTGQNLRHDVNPGGVTIVDGGLAYVVGTPATGITAVAYTNNDVQATTGTALFDIDSSLNQVVQQVPANDGTLSLTGALGVNAEPVAGFDIWTGRRANGEARNNLGFATLRTPGTQRSILNSIDMLSGKASRIGAFNADVADLAVIQP